MFYLLLECADYFEKFLDKNIKDEKEFECRELTAKLTTDVIGVCAFGLKMNAIDDENSKFRVIGRSVFHITKFKLIKYIIRQTMPWLFKLLCPLMYDKEMNDFFIGTMKETMEQRIKSGIKRNDFVDILVHLKQNPEKLGNIGK